LICTFQHLRQAAAEDMRLFKMSCGERKTGKDIIQFIRTISIRAGENARGGDLRERNDQTLISALETRDPVDVPIPLKHISPKHRLNLHPSIAPHRPVSQTTLQTPPWVAKTSTTGNARSAGRRVNLARQITLSSGVGVWWRNLISGGKLWGGKGVVIGFSPVCTFAWNYNPHTRCPTSDLT
jgi:hypothetical protein